MSSWCAQSLRRAGYWRYTSILNLYFAPRYRVPRAPPTWLRQLPRVFFVSFLTRSVPRDATLSSLFSSLARCTLLMILDLPNELMILVIQPRSLGRLCCTCKDLRLRRCISELWLYLCELWKSICNGTLSDVILLPLLQQHPTSVTQSWRDECHWFLIQCADSRKRRARQRLEEGRRVQEGYAQMLNQTCDTTAQSVPLRRAALLGPVALQSKRAQLQHGHGQARQRLHALEAEVVTFEKALAQADRACVQLMSSARGGRGAARDTQPMPMLLPKAMATTPETIAMSTDCEMSEATGNVKQLITQWYKPVVDMSSTSNVYSHSS